MIRVALLAAGFASIVLVLILLQPTGDADAPQVAAAAQEEDMVTRTDTGYDALDSLAQNLSRLNETVAEQDNTPGAAGSAQASAGAPAVAPVVVDTASTSAATPQTPVRTRGVEQNILSALSEALSYQESETPGRAVPLPETLPETLLTSDGRVDTAVLLSALQLDGFAAGQDEIHVVEPGDSLKALSYRFYGGTAHVATILDANRALLTTPSELSAGKQIIIPAPR